MNSQKRADYILFLKVIELIESQEHLTLEGLMKILAIKASMNRGLSEKLKLAFPYIVPVVRPLVKNQKIKDPQWLAGFTSGESSFIVKLTASKTHSIGFKVQLVFQVVQHSRDEQLMISLIEYFDCGIIFKHSENTVVFIVTKFIYIVENIIPFFKKYQIHGVKAKDFEDFCLVAELMKEKKTFNFRRSKANKKKIKAVINIGRKN